MIDVSMSIQAPSGWLVLEDRPGGYELHKDTRAEVATAWRRQEIKSNFVEGSYITNAVKENAVEAVVVYVHGVTPSQLQDRVTALTDAFEQMQYQIKLHNGDLQETWDCTIADYVVQTPQEMINSTMAVVKAQVPRRPTVTRA